MDRFGYRSILMSNTFVIGVLLVLFAAIGLRTPLWVIVLLAFLYGAFSTLQFTSMNTLVYADVAEEDTSAASTIFATMQQMALSFGVAIAGLATAFFLPEHIWSVPAIFIHGIHKAFIALGVLTVVSTVVFRNLRPRDGLSISRQRLVHAG
ncbi:MAG: MFS transporter [Acidobacteriota bacterium]